MTTAIGVDSCPRCLATVGLGSLEFRCGAFCDRCEHVGLSQQVIEYATIDQQQTRLPCPLEDCRQTMTDVYVTQCTEPITERLAFHSRSVEMIVAAGPAEQKKKIMQRAICSLALALKENASASRRVKRIGQDAFRLWRSDQLRTGVHLINPGDSFGFELHDRSSHVVHILPAPDTHDPVGSWRFGRPDCEYSVGVPDEERVRNMSAVHFWTSVSCLESEASRDNVASDAEALAFLLKESSDTSVPLWIGLWDDTEYFLNLGPDALSPHNIAQHANAGLEWTELLTSYVVENFSVKELAVPLLEIVDGYSGIVATWRDHRSPVMGGMQPWIEQSFRATS